MSSSRDVSAAKSVGVVNTGPPVLDVSDIRMAVYRYFIVNGRDPGVSELANELGLSPEEIKDGMQFLARQRLVLLDGESGELLMAHPFSARNMGFVVAGSRQKWWGGCSWESFAIPMLVGERCLTSTRCKGCGAPFAIDVAPGSPPPPSSIVAHFLVPVSDMWIDVLHTCTNQALFCTSAHLEDWLQETGNRRGAEMSLDVLWHVATDWYRGRFGRDVRPRTADQITQFFVDHGLVGDFWRAH